MPAGPAGGGYPENERAAARGRLAAEALEQMRRLAEKRGRVRVWARALRRPATARRVLGAFRGLIDCRSDLPAVRPEEFLVPGTYPWFAGPRRSMCCFCSRPGSDLETVGPWPLTPPGSWGEGRGLPGLSGHDQGGVGRGLALCQALGPGREDLA